MNATALVPRKVALEFESSAILRFRKATRPSGLKPHKAIFSHFPRDYITTVIRNDLSKSRQERSNPSLFVQRF
jgi:hypothetical protein